MATPTLNSVPTSAATTSSPLIFGTKWGAGPMGSPVHLTYSFPGDVAHHITPYTNGGLGEWLGWQGANAAERGAFVTALNAWGNVSGLSFSQAVDTATTVGEIRFALTDQGPIGSAAHAYYPSNHPAGGDIWMQLGAWHEARNSAVTPGSYDYFALLHEIGHALGIKHSFETSAANPRIVPFAGDSFFYTVMSYEAKPGLGNYATFYPTTPMYYDLVAIQALYGVDTVTNAGTTTYTFVAGKKYWQTIYDAGGSDTIIYKGTLGSTINLNPGKLSTLSDSIVFADGSSSRATVSIGPNTVIEHAVGGFGNDTLTGNAANNTLYGLAGADILSAGIGTDTLQGGAGVDYLHGGVGRDVFVFNTVLGPSNVDRIADFLPIDDTIRLENAVFGALPTVGMLSAAAFHTGVAAHDPSDRIIYNRTAGALFYDSDGTGAAAAVKFANLAAGLMLTNADFAVI